MSLGVTSGEQNTKTIDYHRPRIPGSLTRGRAGIYNSNAICQENSNPYDTPGSSFSRPAWLGVMIELLKDLLHPGPQKALSSATAKNPQNGPKRTTSPVGQTLKPGWA